MLTEVFLRSAYCASGALNAPLTHNMTARPYPFLVTLGSLSLDGLGRAQSAQQAIVPFFAKTLAPRDTKLLQIDNGQGLRLALDWR